MTFLEDLKLAIRHNQPISPLLDGCIRPPAQSQNPLVTLAQTVFGKEQLEAHVVNAIKDNLFNAIKDNQNVFELLNSTEGRVYLHAQLDNLLLYLTSSKFNTRYTCPRCKVPFTSKVSSCPSCGTALRWK